MQLSKFAKCLMLSFVCSISVAQGTNYITLESETGNTIVDEKGTWLLGPYNNLHVEYIDKYDKNVYVSFNDNGTKRYMNLTNGAYMPSGYDYIFYYNYAKAITDGGYKYVTTDGHMVIDKTITNHNKISDTLLLVEINKAWYLYNKKTGSAVVDMPLMNEPNYKDYYYDSKWNIKVLKVNYIDGSERYVTDDGKILTANEKASLLETLKQVGGIGEGNDDNYEGVYSRKPAEYYKLVESDDVPQLYGVERFNEIIIKPEYKAVDIMGDDFDYFFISSDNHRWNIVNEFNFPLIPFDFEAYRRLSDRSFVLHRSDKEVIFNAENGNLSTYEYEEIDTNKPYYMLNHVTVAKKGNQRWLIDSNYGIQYFEIPEGVDDITGYYHDLVIFISNGKYGLMNKEGNIIIDAQFDKIDIDEPLLKKYIERTNL